MAVQVIQEIADARELTATSRKLLEQAGGMARQAKSLSGPQREELETAARNLVEEAKRLARLADRVVKRAAS